MFCCFFIDAKFKNFSSLSSWTLVNSLVPLRGGQEKTWMDLHLKSLTLKRVNFRGCIVTILPHYWKMNKFSLVWISPITLSIFVNFYISKNHNFSVFRLYTLLPFDWERAKKIPFIVQLTSLLIKNFNVEWRIKNFWLLLL